MTIQKLVKTWALPDRTQERQQLTLRLNYDLYAKLHALKEVYPNRSVNDMINDILAAGLDEIIEALPVYKMSEEEAHEMAGYTGQHIDNFIDSPTGPRIKFDYSYKRLLEAKSLEETNQEAA